MDIKLLENIIKENDYSAFRLKQAKKSVFARLVADWDEASDLPADLRALLKEKAPISGLEPLSREESAKKDALKILFRARDGFLIEAVLMRHERNRRTVCVSSQAGCAMNCSFCATGKLGFNRNLTVEEIIDQILYFARLLKATDEKITNVVYMGMGEPFNNYDNVMESVRILNDKDCFNLGARRISISTCGIISGIKKFADENLQVNLAISLHAPNDEIRSRIMPVNRVYSLSKLMPAIAEYVAKTKRKVMFEYILLSEVNDGDECARELAVLMKVNKLYHINLIKYHQTFAKDSATRERRERSSRRMTALPTFRASSQKQMDRFFDILKKAGVSCTFRVSFGEDIAGACGQLAGK